jgi:hypothetical protein
MTQRMLYGFSAREIQKFILRSDKLREMAGGSELVNRLCGEYLEAGLSGLGIPANAVDPVTQAAGWARLVFHDSRAAEVFHQVWPLFVDRFAPGLQVDQAYVPFAADGWVEASERLEEALRGERNRGQAVLPEAGPLVGRSPRTGLPSVEYDDRTKQWVDRETVRKLAVSEDACGLLEKLEGDARQEHWPLDMSEIATSEKSYIAVIHADGNSLGRVVALLNDSLQGGTADGLAVFKGFSTAVEEATRRAARKAFGETVRPHAALDENGKPVIPLRPIVLGGDDLTVIVRAQLAFAFCEEFLKRFEEESEAALRTHLGGFQVRGLPRRLTASAGVAFVKKAYPFSRGYDLAESLCRDAKQVVRERARSASPELQSGQSCVAFHKVTTSIAGDYSKVRESELTSRDGGVRLWLGPYGVGPNAPSLPAFAELKRLASSLRELPAGPLHALVSKLYENPRESQASLERMKEVIGETAEGKTRFAKFMEPMKVLTGGSILDAAGHCPLLEALTLAEMLEPSGEERRPS